MSAALTDYPRNVMTVRANSALKSDANVRRSPRAIQTARIAKAILDIIIFAIPLKALGSAIPNIDLARAMTAMSEAVHTRLLEQAKVTRAGWHVASVRRSRAAAALENPLAAGGWPVFPFG